MKHMDKNRKRVLKHLAAGMAAGVFAAFSAASAFAQSPQFGRTAEEWAQLQDNKLEWGEIPGLIEEYNATVKARKAELDSDKLRAKSSQATSDTLAAMADDYDSMAAAAESTTGGAMTAASYRVMADQLRSQAAENVSDARILQLEFERMKAEVTKGAKDLFVEYHRSLSAKKAGESQTAYLNRAWQSAQNRQRYGMGTQLETLSALENLQKAQAAQTGADAQVSETYKQLITMCGWKYDAAAEIGLTPEADLASIDALDAAADQAKALENSITLKEDAIKIENAKAQYGESVVNKWENQLAADQNTIKTGYKTAYDALKQARAAYDSAVSAFQVKAGDLAAAARQLNLGTISQMEYLTAQNAADTAQLSKENALYDLIEKKTAYDAYVAGLS